MIDKINFDCKSFKGHIPCKPNKEHDYVCGECPEYIKASKRILIIKLGAIGDVIRTTCLLDKFDKVYPNCHITWLTLSPAVLPKDRIDTIYKFDFVSLYTLRNTEFDIAINLDKEAEACMLLADVKANEKLGFIWREGHIAAANQDANHKLVTGLYDNISKLNTKSYQEEIYEICGFKFNGEPYILNFNEKLGNQWKQSFHELAKGKTIVGLNTGCGARWQTRLWPDSYWIDLIKQLHNQGYFVVVLGGEAEDVKNRYLAEQSDCHYPGHFSLEEFISLTSACDIIVTQVSMMMHIAIGLKKYMVLMNNIFNKHEFELYNNGVIVEPPTECECFYGNTCKRGESCMKDIKPATILAKVEAYSLQEANRV